MPQKHLQNQMARQSITQTGWTGQTKQASKHKYTPCTQWKWTGYCIHSEDNKNSSKKALEWNRQGKRKPGCSRNSWRRSTTKEFKKTWKPSGM